jgi:cytochrome c-type biogenesis protein CcmH/NrfG
VPLKKENVLILIIALIIGLLGGFLIFSVSSKKEASLSSSDVPVGAGSPVDYQKRIAELEKVVANEPKNVQAWIMLGNDYYDTDQAQKAISAYDKVLALDPKNTSVLTDQGVMYKRVGWYDKALANFEKAQEIDPKHLQSLYNIGVIYAEDMKQPDKALKAWNHYLELDSTSPAAQQVKRFIEQQKLILQKGSK